MVSRLRNKLFYGWVILIVLFIFSIILFGLNFSFGFFFKSIAGEFNLSRGATSAIQSTVMLLGGVFAFIGGRAIDKYGPRLVFFLMGLFTGLSLLLTSRVDSLGQLFFTYGLLLPMGTGAVYVATMSTVLRWFKKNRGLALGIASLGVGLGTVIIAPFATYLISTFDWRTAYVVMALITWVVILPLSSLLRREPQEIVALSNINSTDNNTGEASGFSLSKFLRTWQFWTFASMWFLLALCIFLIFTHLVPHITDIGFSAGEAAAVLSLIGLMATAGRVLMGIASDRLGSKTSSVICAVMMMVSMFWLIWSEKLWMFYLFALVYGIGFGGVGTCMAAMIGDIFGVRQIGALLGTLSIAWGIGAAVGPVLGGLAFDFTASYSLAFLIAALAPLAAALLIFTVRREVV